MQLHGEILDVAKLSSRRRDEMFALMKRYYDNMRRTEFDADLDEKDWVIQVFDSATDVLCGFSTQMVFEVDVAGRLIRVLFSGDTIIDRAHWHHNPLAGLRGGLALRLIDRFAPQELHWHLLSKGYKTYRFLPIFFREFYPRFDQPTPPGVSKILNSLGKYKFPERYDSEAGIVRADAGGCRLKNRVGKISRARLRDPHVRYFCERNPRHESGDELCCVAPLTRDNFTAAAWKVIPSTADRCPELAGWRT